MARSVASAAETPAPARRPASRPSGRGMNAFKQATKSSSKKFDSDFFKVDYGKTYVIKFLEPENYDFVFRHELEDVPQDDGSVWKYVPRNCIKDEENGVSCPLCAIGDDPKPLALFNVVSLDEPGKVLVWEVSKGIFEDIDDLATLLSQVPEDRGGPLDLDSPDVYVAVSKKKTETKSGKGGFTKYSLQRVKPRDLDEDHGLDPLDEEQLAGLLSKLKTSDDIRYNTREELAELAARLED